MKLVEFNQPKMSDMMENIFNNEEYGWKVRTIVEGGEVLFVAKDVADILGYSETAAMTRHLDSDEVQKIKSADLTGLTQIVGNNDISLITESGLYSAILKSRREESKAFKKWVTGTVLPSIRKTGTYSETPQIRQTVDERLLDSLGRMVMVIEKHSDYLDRMVRVVEKNSDYLNRTSDFMIRSKFAEKDPVQDNPHLIPEPKRWAVSSLIPRLEQYYIVSDAALSQIGKTMTKIAEELQESTGKEHHPRFPEGVKTYQDFTVREFFRRTDVNKEFLKKFRK